jgi:DNA-binding GntR family transcriptional regulator
VEVDVLCGGRRLDAQGAPDGFAELQAHPVLLSVSVKGAVATGVSAVTATQLERTLHASCSSRLTPGHRALVKNVSPSLRPTLPGRPGFTRRSSSAARAYEVAKERLLDGSYEPGTLLSENEFAKELGISRTPVREAFLQLEAEDLLDLYPRRGALVKPISPSEADDVLEARLLIETHCAARVAAGGREVVAALRASIADQEQALRHSGTVGGPGFVIADREFHRLIVAANGNDLLTRQYDALRDRQQRIAATAVARDPGRIAEFIREHGAIADAIDQRDPESAVKSVAAHLRHANDLARRPRP